MRLAPSVRPLEGRLSLSFAPVPYSWSPAAAFAPAWSPVPTAPAMTTVVALAGTGPVARVSSEVFRGPAGYAYLYQVTTLSRSPLWGLSWRSAPGRVEAVYGGRLGGLPAPGPLDWPGLLSDPSTSTVTATAPLAPGHTTRFVVFAPAPPRAGHSQRLVAAVGWGAVLDPLSNLPAVYAP